MNFKKKFGVEKDLTNRFAEAAERTANLEQLQSIENARNPKLYS